MPGLRYEPATFQSQTYFINHHTVAALWKGGIALQRKPLAFLFCLDKSDSGCVKKNILLLPQEYMSNFSHLDSWP